MGKLVKIINNRVVVAHNYVATPTYKLYVKDFTNGEAPVDGWVYCKDDAEVAAIVPVWSKPNGADEQYAVGDSVLHSGRIWVSICDDNEDEPGLSNWVPK